MTALATAAAAPSRRLGTIGCVMGLIALVAAILPHWVLPAVYPPPPAAPVNVHLGLSPRGGLAVRFGDAERQAPRPDRARAARWSDASSLAAISLGLLAIVLAVAALIFREERLLAGVAAALGVAAIGVEVSVIAFGVFLFVALVYAAANFLDLC